MKGAQCTMSTMNKCELGDMSGKFGKIKFESTEKVQFENIAYLDPTIALSDGEHSVLGRSIVVHDPSGARIACGNIEKIQIDAQTKFQKK
ncbi:hypothetical protein BDF19DRAFT_447039 [Syncephalis fuscata]|nr:hypothetical protein BDF19DRAFT_447039 [Syncephalis fuscata]